jgi:hypothetical protein
MMVAETVEAEIYMVEVEQGATPETGAVEAQAAQAAARQAPRLTVATMVIAAVAAWGLMGRALQEVPLTMLALAVLAEKHLTREKTDIQATALQ